MRVCVYLANVIVCAGSSDALLPAMRGCSYPGAAESTHRPSAEALSSTGTRALLAPE